MKVELKRYEKGLGHAARAAFAEFFVEYPLMHGVLVEYEQGIVLLREDEIGAGHLPQPAEIVEREDFRYGRNVIQRESGRGNFWFFFLLERSGGIFFFSAVARKVFGAPSRTVTQLSRIFSRLSRI